MGKFNVSEFPFYWPDMVSIYIAYCLFVVRPFHRQNINISTTSNAWCVMVMRPKPNDSLLSWLTINFHSVYTGW